MSNTEPPWPGARTYFASCDIIAAVRTPGANAVRVPLYPLDASGPDYHWFCLLLTAAPAAQAVAERGARLAAMELVPRITRAQSMDALSSMATIAGYKAVLLAAGSLPRMFPPRPAQWPLPGCS